MGERCALMTDGVTTIIFHLPEGELFKLDSAIPGKFLAEFYVSPREFLGELAYLKQALRGKSQYVVRFSEGSLSTGSGGEWFATKINAAGSNSVVFGFKLDFMVDALEQFKKEPCVKLKFSGPLGPIIMEAEGRNDFAMVLPVRLREGFAAA